MRMMKIHPTDNVAVVLERDGEIPAGHKIAINDIPAGGNVIKYGYSIGTAIKDIANGEHVHTHNLKTGLSGLLEYKYEPDFTHPAPHSAGTFMGYRRPDGKSGVRNEVWIVPTVGCVNGIAQALAKNAAHLVLGNVDGIHAFPHPYGCSQLGDDHENTRRALCGLINHPNAGGVLVLGLGCENNTLDGMKELLGDFDSKRVKFLSCQESGNELEEGAALLEELVGYASAFEREPIPTSELIIGLKCGGSDGFSGITANPLVGAFSDKLIAEGGSAILTEVPEMFGAETILMNRCVDREIFDKTVDMINNFKEYYIKNGQNVYENPSPGNKAGGISTLEDKALGCTQKCGSANVVDVLAYAQAVSVKGLNLLNAPGNDLVAASSLAASGAHIVLFTTGRGTPFGCPVPTVKISTNTALFENKPHWIDFNAGTLLSGSDMDGLSNELYEFVLNLASGKILAKNEIENAREFTVFKTGVTL